MSEHELAGMRLMTPVASMTELAVSIAHEVSQPLSAIAVNARCCLRWLSTEQPDLDMIRRAAERIVRDGEHATEVIRSVRAMHCNTSRELSVVDVNEVISDAVDLMRSELIAHRITLETQLCGAAFVQADRTQIKQVLVNLISNGIDAMRSTSGSRTLQVCSAKNGDGDVLVTVSDTGPGLDPSIAERIFEPFVTTKNGGMGLGLAISRSIALRHGGYLCVRPHIPHGCIFDLTLPAYDRC